ncbi:MAG: hypothetical protein K8R67_11105 [Desulfobacteraceae bacterium]|nr:hypothetical protein [Desulfobacteraceae bacterium]
MKVYNFVSLYFYPSFLERGNLKSFISVFVILFLLGGCSHHYIPVASTYKLDSIIEFSTNHSISIVNSQLSTSDVLFATNGAHKFYGNLQSWTDTAIKITQRELTKRDMSVVKDAQKTLKVSIETVKGTFGVWVIRCETTLKVETSEGYVNTYSGDNRSPATLYLAADGAVMRAVTEMLRDEKIISYLKK